jgi:hypothetical protein
MEQDGTKKRIILFVQGGAGDVLAATPMIRGFRNKYPQDEILVTSTYAQLLEGNPHIDVLVPLKEPKDFYDMHVANSPHPVRFYRKRFVYDYIMERDGEEWLGASSLPEFICRCYGADYDGKPLDYFPTDYELRAMKTMSSQSKNPIVLLHIFGAVPSDGQPTKTNKMKDLNPAIVSPLVEKYKSQFDFLQIGLEGEPVIPGAVNCLGMPMRDTIALMKYAKTGIMIESLFAHCANATGLPVIVVHQNMNFKFFGHPTNLNITWSGGCQKHPCNRPAGALVDLGPGYLNPKTRQQVLWDCNPQLCAQMPTEFLEKHFLEVVNRQPIQPATTLEEARQQ